LKRGPWGGALTAMLLLASVPIDASAHTRERPTPETLWSSWNFNPLVSVGILLATWLYLRGVFALWRSGGADRGIRRWQVWAFLGGMVTMIIAVISPLDALGAALFSAHMVQHVLLFLVAPMLLALSRPALAISWAIPFTHRKRVLTWAHGQPGLRSLPSLLSNPVIVWMIFTGVLWIWHVPAMYDAALRSDLVHHLEHLTFLFAAYLFWAWILQPSAGRASRRGLAVLFVFTSVMQSGLLGAILTFAPGTIYAGHLPYTAAWNLTSLEDQQLAGLIMWIPMGLWFTLTTLFLFFAWLRDADRSVRQWESDLDRGAPEAATSQGR
jgi:putative membrane protein